MAGEAGTGGAAPVGISRCDFSMRDRCETVPFLRRAGASRDDNRRVLPVNLVFHAGLHKTGTTTFQRALASLQAPLRACDVHVPVVNGTANMGHSVVYLAQRGDWSGYEHVLDQARTTLTPKGTLLFSAEDLENCLYDAEFGRQFMVRAAARGVTSIRWVFVLRNEFEYFESLYGELSKHDQVLQYDLMAHEILEHGFFSCATPRFRWYFAFRYREVLSRFQSQVCDRMTCFTFREFIRPVVGAVLFRLCGREREYSAWQADVPQAPRNVRMSDEDVERKYVATFLRLGGCDTRSAEWAERIDGLVARRLEARLRSRPAVFQRFGDTMCTVPPLPEAR